MTGSHLYGQGLKNPVFQLLESSRGLPRCSYATRRPVMEDKEIAPASRSVSALRIKLQAIWIVFDFLAAFFFLLRHDRAGELHIW